MDYGEPSKGVTRCVGGSALAKPMVHQGWGMTLGAVHGTDVRPVLFPWSTRGFMPGALGMIELCKLRSRAQPEPHAEILQPNRGRPCAAFRR